ncbi:MAG TPA: hypothetical protein VLF43_04745 [Candidatus Saccharimonadales bacterium]|nr:hypothetical protein [Candidatus Saccharimonadales bacterium]
MRTKRFIIIGLTLAIVIFIIAVTISGGGKKTALNPCPDFFAAIQKGDINGSYGYFSKDAMALQTKDQWKTTVDGLRKAYSTVKPVAMPSSTVLSDAKGAKLPATAQEKYQVNNGGITYIATCYLTLNGSSYQVDAFNSYASTNGVD